jgi:hypothetical protein
VILFLNLFSLVCLTVKTARYTCSDLFTQFFASNRTRVLLHTDTLSVSVFKYVFQIISELDEVKPGVAVCQ